MIWIPFALLMTVGHANPAIFSNGTKFCFKKMPENCFFVSPKRRIIIFLNSDRIVSEKKLSTADDLSSSIKILFASSLTAQMLKPSCKLPIWARMFEDQRETKGIAFCAEDLSGSAATAWAKLREMLPGQNVK